jgi:hypothetical protein
MISEGEVLFDKRERAGDRDDDAVIPEGVEPVGRRLGLGPISEVRDRGIECRTGVFGQ